MTRLHSKLFELTSVLTLLMQNELLALTGVRFLRWLVPLLSAVRPTVAQKSNVRYLRHRLLDRGG